MNYSKYEFIKMYNTGATTQEMMKVFELNYYQYNTIRKKLNLNRRNDRWKKLTKSPEITVDDTEDVEFTSKLEKLNKIQEEIETLV